MREWTGMRRDSDHTADDGSLLALNVRYWRDGEVQRRRGIDRLTTTAGGPAIGMLSVPAKRKRFSIHATPGGNLVTVEL